MFRILHIPTNTFVVMNIRKSFLESLVDPDFVNSHTRNKFKYHFAPNQFKIAEFSEEAEIEIAFGYLKKRYPTICLEEMVPVEF